LPASPDGAGADPSQAFFRSAEPYRGELIPPFESGEFVPFGGDEGHWTSAGAEMPAEWARVKEEVEAKGGGRRA
jgi:hypothetical protein